MKHAFSSLELFRNFGYKLKNADRLNYYKNSQYIAAKIFEECMYRILLDIIENNITFVLPLPFGNYAELHAQSYTDEEFKKIYRSGGFRSIDFIKSNFTGNRIMYRWEGKNKSKHSKPVHLHGELYNKLKDKTEQGKRYW